MMPPGGISQSSAPHSARLQPDRACAALKRAAVAIALTRGEGGSGTAFLLTLRAAGLRAHRGAMGAAGRALRRRRDAGRRRRCASCMKNSGFELDERDVLGLLDDYPTRSGYLITPGGGVGGHG